MFSRSIAQLTPLIPIVLENTPSGTRSYDIYSRLLTSRIISLTGPVTDHLSSLITSQMLYLESVSPTEPIKMYINSPGGSVTAGLAIFDTMNYVSPPVHTICMGQACSMGSLLLAGGEKGNRFALENSRIMVHQPSGGAQGMASDIQIQAQEILKLRSLLNGLYVDCCGRDLKEVEDALDRDTFLSPVEAKEWGIVDEVLKTRGQDQK